MKIITNICLLLILVAGYQDQVSTMSAAPTEISGRLDAALAMKNNTARHNTLVQVGQDAAEAGEGDVVLKVIALIDAGSSHDNLCSMCSKERGRNYFPISTGRWHRFVVPFGA